jgi:hypothetical protein
VETSQDDVGGFTDDGHRSSKGKHSIPRTLCNTYMPIVHRREVFLCVGAGLV